jgi:hypothetical protein
MLAVERIQQYVQKLPRPLQAEVLDFVEYLLSKAERETSQADGSDWRGLSLAYAMRGMENEVTPTYTTADLKVTF